MSQALKPVPGDLDRAPAVRDMFARIAPRYVSANQWMSLGIDGVWRRQAIAAMGPAAKGDVLDLCAGTMDFTLALAKTSRSLVALDFCAPMLQEGERRMPPGTPYRTIVADARALPLPDASVDGIVAGFGIRNVPEPHKAVAEALRVLRPGGVFVVVDFFLPRSVLAHFFDRTWNRVMLPWIGGMLTGDRAAYQYLVGSMRAWVDRPGFEKMCIDAGFVEARGRELFPPVASLVVAKKAGPFAAGEGGA